MPLYFVQNEHQRLGPYTREELNKLQLKPHFLIWRRGFAQWRPAGSMEELAALLPPPINATPPSGEPPELDDGDDVPAPINPIYLGTICIIGLLLWGIGFPGQTYALGGLVLYIGLATGAWYALMLLLMEYEGKSARWLWLIIMPHLFYLFAYILNFDLHTIQRLSGSTLEAVFCAIAGNCGPQMNDVLLRMGEIMDEYRIFFLINTGAVLIACVYLWRLSSDYGSKLTYLALSTAILVPSWMIIHWLDREMEMISMSVWSGAVLLLPYCLIVAFLWEFE